MWTFQVLQSVVNSCDVTRNYRTMCGCLCVYVLRKTSRPTVTTRWSRGEVEYLFCQTVVWLRSTVVFNYKSFTDKPRQTGWNRRYEVLYNQIHSGVFCFGWFSLLITIGSCQGNLYSNYLGSCHMIYVR